MFQWLRKKRRNRNREIFRFWDGSRKRGIDPMVVLRSLHVHPTFNAETHPQAAMAGDAEAMSITMGAMREIFGLEAWTEDASGERGLTDQETLSLYEQFGDWLDALKKNSSPLPITPVATPPADCTADSTAAETITSVSSDST